MALLTTLSSCFRHSKNDISISVKETSDVYQLSAYFDKARKKEVQYYIGKCMGDNNFFRSGNVEIDANTTLDDHTHFYIRSIGGELKIKLNKEDNSWESYTRVKRMCEGLKNVLTNNRYKSFQ